MSLETTVSMPVRRLRFDPSTGRPSADLEWIVTNGLGGYASGPVGGGLTRRFHGLLIAALPAPLGRMLYLTKLRTIVEIDGRETLIDHESVAALAGPDVAPLREFRLEYGLPVWEFETDDFAITQRVVMPFGQNTVHVTLCVTRAVAPVRLRLAPMLHVRPHEGALAAEAIVAPLITVDGAAAEVVLGADRPDLHWLVAAPSALLTFDAPAQSPVDYAIERGRGYDSAGSLWTPGWITVDAAIGQDIVFIASTESWDRIRTAPGQVPATERARRETLLLQAGSPADEIAAELTIAADAFLITPMGRAREVALARAAGEEPRSVIAGYHWFTDWGRDTMISLEGLTLETGRAKDAERILRNFAHHVRDGLIPNMFPEGEHHGLYHTADATLWFVHAVERYVAVTGDRAIVADLLPTFVDIVEHHLAGTRFNIRVDPDDGLLSQGADHYQLTWMDAKVGDWVVTPRRGKAVEINALWYNALGVIGSWLDAHGQTGTAQLFRAAAAKARQSFNARFWNEDTGHLFDVVDGEDGDDPACRPNQVLAISLPHPVLDQPRWAAVVETVEARLITPVGLRSLSPDHPKYQPRYFGDLRARDAAYHQGTVWAWLIGAFIDAWLKVHPGELAAARRFLSGFPRHLDDGGIGTVSEIFDAEPPFTQRGCIAQAWSVAELLRVWNKTRG